MKQTDGRFMTSINTSDNKLDDRHIMVARMTFARVKTT